MKNPIEWPLLLRNFHLLKINKKQEYYDYKRNEKSLNFLERKNKKGLINFDKPFGCNSHEIISWMKKFLNFTHIRCLGKSASNISGCMIFCFGKFFLVNELELLSKTNYILIYNFQNSVRKNFKGGGALQKFNSNLFKNHFVFSKTKQQLKLNKIFQTFHLEFDSQKKMGIFEISIQFPISVRSLVINLGFLTRRKIKLLEIRRIRIANFTEEESLTSFHDLLDARWIEKYFKKSFFFRKIIIPFDILFSDFRRILIKDSSISSICFGAGLTYSGILKMESNIELGEKIALINSMGEPVAIGISKVNTISIFNSFSGLVVDIKVVFMEKNFYKKKWHLGLTSTKKNILLSIGIHKFFKKKKFNNLKWWKK